MPKQWLYFAALLFPLVFRVVILDTGFLDWLWYAGHQDEYNMLNQLRAAPLFLQFIGGWPLPVFVLTVIAYWMIDGGGDNIPAQFLLLPIAYVPFTILGDIIQTQEFHSADLFVHPLVILPAGYLYIFSWVVFIWLLEKLRLVL